MRKVKLGEIGKVVTGKTPSTKNPLFFSDDYMFITPEDITYNPSNIYKSKRYISKSGIDTILSNSINGESVVVGCIGSDMGNVGYVNCKCATNQQLNSITEIKNDYNAKFLYYNLKQQKDYFKKIAGSTTTPILPKSVFEEIEISLPDLSTQTAIVNVLSSLDGKIELNNKINKELEAMAKALYDYWFVQFDFPDKNGNPYKSSGGKMVWNDDVKKNIPAKWTSCPLKQFIVNINNSTNPGKHLEGQFYTPIDELPKKQMSFYGGLSSNEAKSSLQMYKIGDILLGAMRVYFHRVCIAAQNGITRSTTMVLRLKNKENLPFIYQLVNQDITIEYAVKISVGTQQPYVTWDNALSNYTVILPDDNYITMYSKIINPLIEKLFFLVKENYYLSQLRDFLLPLLMNGQVQVTEAESIINKTQTTEKQDYYNQRFELWLKNQNIAARGNIDRQTLREIFDAMDDDDK